MRTRGNIGTSLGRRLLWPFLAFSLALAWAMTPAGTVIRNQAVALVGQERYLSNPVETVVASLCVPLLSPDGTPTSPGQEARVSPGGYAHLPYVLTNGGNSPFTFRLSHLLGPRDFTPEEVAFFPDQNADGLPDGATPIAQATLAMGESLRLVLRVKAPLGATGSLLLTPVAACPDGREDRENWARLVAARGPILSLEKQMPLEGLPGQEILVVLRVRNLGDQEALRVVVQDEPLPLPFLPGSAAAPKGRVEYFDGTAWQLAEPPAVRGVRLVLDRLRVGEEAFLSFRMRIPPGTPPQEVVNVARAKGPGSPAEGRAVVRVLPLWEHHLGPKGNPRALPGGEGSADDRQGGRALAGQPFCFAHTLENAGTGQDAYTLRLEGLPSGVGYNLLDLGGAPLALPLVLAPGERRDFQVCYLVPDALSFTAKVVAVSAATGRENATWDALAVVAPGALTLVKEADPPSGTTLRPGDEIAYTLRLQNAFAPLSRAVVEDPLSPYVEFVAASHGGAYDPAGHRVVWTLDPLPVGETLLTLRVRVRGDAPDDALVENAFLLRSAETPNPIRSNPVRHPVFGASLLLKKEVRPQTARVGDLLTYRLILKNPSSVPLTVRLTDTPPSGTRYEAGTAYLGCSEPRRVAEPRVEEGRLIWEGLALPGKGELCLEYRLRILPGAPENLVNAAEALGNSSNGAAVASGKAQALARLDPTPFTLGGVLLGRVFLDLDGNGVFGRGDVPLPGARVLLANGVQALTDASGRYAFRGLVGLHQVMLDPASAPFPPLALPEDLGEGYRKRVLVQGATVVDFPLRPPKGFVRFLRSTTLRMGPFAVEKRLLEVEGKFMVELRLRSAEVLPELTLTDPLPEGGEKVFQYEAFSGEETLVYAVPLPTLTDPQVRWRYP
ncbi:DUF11 domain-containing protein [Thermus tenuipuniceus]|uniref:DUF11 domain-containing protein n=1 Tax=Thermus tenuipuniceus TaxID=2078690 RepID=UPI000FF8AC44|nr:DUF11 domain-containing protein [Thermus tenuipuniceus]